MFYKEVRDFFRFFFATPYEEKSIVFYAEHEGYYPNFEGLITELLTVHKQKLCYVSSDPDDPILNIKREGINPFYINRLLPFFMIFVNCRVFVMTLTDLDQYHLRRSPVHPVHYVYVFHSLVSTHGYNPGAFDHYDSILCAGPHHVEEIRARERKYNLEPKDLKETGYYRLERIYEGYKKQGFQKPTGGKGTVLVAPTWAKDNILEYCGEQLVHILLKAGYRVIVRPHPETVYRCPGLVESVASQFGHNSNFILEKTIVTDDSLFCADALISELSSSGISLEYAFGTERPVLFLDVPIQIYRQDFSDIGTDPLELSLRSYLGIVVSPRNLETVPEVVTELITNRQLYRRKIVKLRERYIYAFGQSSKVGAKHIISLV